jgi:hypothetical protein
MPHHLRQCAKIVAVLTLGGKMRIWFALAVAATMALSLPASAQSGGLTEFRVETGDKHLGRYDMAVVRNEGGVFVVGNFYAGKKALTGKKRGTPEKRLYAELTVDGVLGKCKRWVRKGSNEEYRMLFQYEKEVKMRVEKVEGGRGEVSTLGEVTSVSPMDLDSPALAMAILGAEPAERVVPCAGFTKGAFGQAKVSFAGPQEFPVSEEETISLNLWKIEGDCGTAEVYLDESGAPVRFKTADDKIYVKFNRK